MTKKEVVKKTTASNKSTTKKSNKTVIHKFSKQQLLKSQKYVNCRDALNALLNENETYTHDDAERILKEFYKGGKK